MVRWVYRAKGVALKLPPMPSSNRLVASFIVAGLILWGAGMIALVFYVQAETSRSNARKELVDKCLGSGGHLVYDPIQKMVCSFEVPTNTLDAIDNRGD